MADIAGKTKPKRASKSERTHQRRLKQAARKPGGAMAVQMAKVKVAGETAKKKAAASTTSPDGPPTVKADE